MGLRLRRGTNTQRQAVTFAEGELIFVTDYVTAGVSPLWIGDGSTAGGKEVETSDTPSLTLDDLTDVVIPAPGAGENEVLAYVGGQWTNTDPASLGISGPLNGLTDVNVPAPAQNNVLTYVGSEWTSVAPSTLFNAGITEGTEYNISINGSVIGADSSIIVDNVTQVVRANLFVGSGAGLTDINLVDLDDVFAFGAVENDVLTYNGTGWIPLPSQGIQLGQTYDINITGNVLGLDSSVIVNASTGIITGDLIGNVTGNLVGDVTGNVAGIVDGDLIGSVFGDDSTILIDSINNTLSIPTFLQTGGEQSLVSTATTTVLRLIADHSTEDKTGSTETWGAIRFSYEDVNGRFTPTIMGSSSDGYYISHDTNGTHGTGSTYIQIQDGKLKLGGFNPAEKLDVNGNGKFSGFVQFGSLTTTERNALTAAAGMVIWNNTTTQFEGFDGTNWINLVDGTTSP